jgi:uncharacterized protein
MARNVLVDAGFLVALLSRRGAHHQCGLRLGRPAKRFSPKHSVFSERRGPHSLGMLLRRRGLFLAFGLGEDLEPVLRLIEKYRDVPMRLADACLVRMSETRADPVILTTDEDRSPGAKVCTCVPPSSGTQQLPSKPLLISADVSQYKPSGRLPAGRYKPRLPRVLTASDSVGLLSAAVRHTSHR